MYVISQLKAWYERVNINETIIEKSVQVTAYTDDLAIIRVTSGRKKPKNSLQKLEIKRGLEINSDETNIWS